MGKYVVARAEEIPPGGSKIIEVAGRSVGVFNVDGSYFALRNRCPHQGGPLCQGQVSGWVISSAPGEYDYTRRGEIVRCPWHGWEFDIRTGRSYFDPARVRVRRYEVSLEGGHAPPPRPTGQDAGAADGDVRPAVETYPVTVERRNVVIEIDDP